MNLLTFSQFLIVFFVGSVTLWYCVTPYLVSPHPRIVSDVLAKTRLSGEAATTAPSTSVRVENWTKWRLYVNSSSAQNQVIYGHSKDSVRMDQSAVMNMEWRSDYTIHVTRPSSSSSNLDVRRQAPAGCASEFGIYNHFVATADDEDSVVKVIPRFLFGLPLDVVEELYGTDVSKFPIVGIFTSSPRFDRVIIQAYMNVVTLSVIFLLYANNPPHAIMAKKRA
jgi:hypothetical protein